MGEKDSQMGGSSLPCSLCLLQVGATGHSLRVLLLVTVFTTMLERSSTCGHCAKQVHVCTPGVHAGTHTDTHFLQQKCVCTAHTSCSKRACVSVCVDTRVETRVHALLLAAVALSCW
jgi:hypothetical protein